MNDPYHKKTCPLGVKRRKTLIVLDTGTYCANCGAELRLVPRRVSVRHSREKRTIAVWAHGRWEFSTSNGC